MGKAVRFGSLVVKMKLPVTTRPYTDQRQYCLFFNSGTCGQCIKRCPAGAVSRAGHDKNLCRPYAFDVNMAHIKATWPELSGAYACGLCQANVPCEKGIPPQPKRAGK